MEKIGGKGEEGNTWKFMGDTQRLDREFVVRGGKDRERFEG